MASHVRQDRGGPLVHDNTPAVEVLAHCTCPVTVTNTTDETSVISSESGGSFLVQPYHMSPGAIIRFKNRGYISTGSAQDSTLRVYFNGATLIESTGTLPNTLADQYVELELDICITGPGKCRYEGRTLLKTSTGISTVAMRSFVSTVESDINTNAPALLSQTYQWANASASNSLTIVEHTLELIRT